MLELIIPLFMFSLSTTITPGPNNIMVTASGVNFGYRRTIPHMIGITVGFPVMVLIIGLGLGEMFKTYPVIQFALRYAGAAYLLYLAWKIAAFKGAETADEEGRPFTFWQAVAFQWINPKGWMMAIGAVSTFTSESGPIFTQVFVIAGMFFLICYPCVSVWAIFGTYIKRLIKHDNFLRRFNVAMALLLVASLALALLI